MALLHKNMLIGILSDTHSCRDSKITQYLQACDEIWHAGDIGDVDTYQWLSGIGPKLRAVHGNIDSEMIRRVCPEMLDFTVEGVNVLMTHIAGYPGHYSQGMRSHILQHKPDIVVAGHSHLLRVMYDKQLAHLHINPGAAGNHGWQQVRTLVRLKIDDGHPHDLEVVELGPRGYNH